MGTVELLAFRPQGSSLVIEGMVHALNPHFFNVIYRAVLDHTSEDRD